MIIKRIDRFSRDIKKLERLYDASFPNEERIPFRYLVASLNKDRIMDAYYSDDELVGLTVMFMADDLAYLSYICIAEKMQGRGYGTQILNVIKDEYRNCRIVIDIEELDPESDNNEERLRRRNFYIRNGFMVTDVFYRYYFVDYEILSFNGLITVDEWKKVIRKHWGKYADYAEYR